MKTGAQANVTVTDLIFISLLCNGGIPAIRRGVYQGTKLGQYHLLGKINSQTGEGQSGNYRYFGKHEGNFKESATSRFKLIACVLSNFFMGTIFTNY